MSKPHDQGRQPSGLLWGVGGACGETMKCAPGGAGRGIFLTPDGPTDSILAPAAPAGQIARKATLTLSEEQVVQLVRQLPPQARQRVLSDLTSERDGWWHTAARDGERDWQRLAAARGLDWNALTDTQREDFVDSLLHES